jgi:hypothetical protein
VCSPPAAIPRPRATRRAAPPRPAAARAGGIDAEDEIAHAVLAAHNRTSSTIPERVEVVAIDIGKWEVTERHALDQSRGLPDHYSAKWTAKLRFKEPLAFILSQVENTFVVQIVAKAGDELAFAARPAR